MLKKPLSTTELSISAISIGSMTWGQQNTEKEAHRQLDIAFDAGVNLIDTAEMYAFPASEKTQGLSEAYIGSWIKSQKSRKNIIVATKVSGRSDYFPYLRPHLHNGITRLDKESISQAVEKSLQRLNLDTIDLYQIHWPERNTNFFHSLTFDPHADDNNPIPIEETLSALHDLKVQGKIRYAGLSNETPWGVQSFLSTAQKLGYDPIVSVQNPYSLISRSYDVGLAEISIRNSISLLAYSPLAGGALSGKYRNSIPKGSRQDLFPHAFIRYVGPHARKLIDLYVELALEHNLSPVQMALAWCIQQPHVSSAIISATTEEQLKESLGAASITLSQELLDSIHNIFKENPFLIA
jgi:aryl-alcohol dehydrogenase-like predicted oxidoreductase